MSSVMPLVFNAMELRVVTINERPWRRAKEVCRVLQYNKKTGDIIKGYCSKENFARKYQLSEFTAAGNFMDWFKDSMYEIVFSSQQSITKDFTRHCCNALFSHVRQQLTNKMKEDHQQPIEEKDTAIALLNDGLKNREHDNVALQAQRDVYNDQLQKCRDIITHLKTRHVPHAKDPGKDNIVMIIEKNTTPKEDEL